MFKALLLEKGNGQQLTQIKELEDSALPSAPVKLKVQYSSINYKDGLAITGKGKIIRNFPMVPGIDLAGEVIEASDDSFEPGTQVLATGWGVGEQHWGGLAEKASLESQWLIPLPESLTPEKAMIIGTAGLTAILCVEALEQRGIMPEDGEILVTGASGGVGSTAVALLHALGYQVVAVTGRNANRDYLLELGASRIIERSEFEKQGRPLEKQLWAGAIDTVGSHILAQILAQTQYGGAVAACGLAAGFDLPTTVMPFILRHVALLGIDSVSYPAKKRPQAWQRLAELLPESFYEQSATTISLDQVETYAQRIVRGQVTGRTLVKL